MTTAVDTDRPAKADPEVWDRPGEWEPGIPLYDPMSPGEMFVLVDDCEDMWTEEERDHLDGHDEDCDVCRWPDDYGFRWAPRKAIELEFRRLCPVKDRFEPFYGATPARRRRRAGKVSGG